MHHRIERNQGSVLEAFLYCNDYLISVPIQSSSLDEHIDTCLDSHEWPNSVLLGSSLLLSLTFDTSGCDRGSTFK